MSDELDGYQVYLLRVWRVLYMGRWQWRASLQSPQAEERQSFADLDGLCNYLKSRFPECQPDVDRKQAPPAGEAEGANSEDEPSTGQVSDRQALSFSP
ncbi:MAG: hypothetical protein EHM56_01870 [Chloroflexi bacterium]|nr:MAG: hypothetical protein EHM56_01870 [Chloroflexota bacterium]